MNSNNKMRFRFCPCGKRNAPTRKFITNCVKVIHVDLECIKMNLMAGKEVRLGKATEGIRLFPLVEKDYKTVKVIAQTFGDFRNALDDEPFELTDDSVSVEDAVKRREADLKRSHSKLSVSPDTMVTCPACGTEFRVGKQLA